MTGNVGTA